MIVASDLDRTLIYSNRALAELGKPVNAMLKPVETRDGNWTAFMTETAFSFLKQLSDNCLFVPVTTRTTEQFKRIVIFEEEVPLTYAITSNGANILYKGELLTEWSAQIGIRMSSESMLQEDFLNKLTKAGFHLEGERKQAESLFFYYILTSLPSDADLLAIRELAVQFGWRASLQGRKLYFIPKVISKENALEFICKREGMEAIAGAGDSVLDWNFLKNCRYRFVPRHGELIAELKAADVTITKQLGIGAGEEILHSFLTALYIKS